MKDTETARGRVRRLLFEPLEAEGFRKSAKVSEEKHKAVMARLADDLVYMSDPALDVLRVMLRSKGQGKARDLWPSVATITGFAEVVEPRPLEELPGLLRWFASIEGPRAMREGTLVEEWEYFRRTKKPPLYARRDISERAADNRRKLELYRERMARDAADAEQIAWVRNYEDRLRYCEALVTGAGKKG